MQSWKRKLDIGATALAFVLVAVVLTYIVVEIVRW